MRSGMVYVNVLTILLMGCLAVTTECRPEAQTKRSFRDGHANSSPAMVNSTAVDGSKLALQFCINKPCRSLPLGEDWPYCFCCETMEGEPCFKDEDSCRAECPICDPDCLLPPSQEIKT
ncbi:unnamed protein product [Alopecurus aequalis]